MKQPPLLLGAEAVGAGGEQRHHYHYSCLYPSHDNSLGYCRFRKDI